VSAPGIRGWFEPERLDVRLDQPFSTELVVHNDGDRDEFVFVPTGRAQGLEIDVLEGGDYAVTGLENEPDVGLVGERRLAPGDSYRQELPLSRWLRLGAAGRYVVECGIPVQVSDRSVRDGGGTALTIEVASRIELNVSVEETRR
jgi:hypothetical protein